MRILTHPVSLAFGISTLCLLFLIGPFVSPSHFLIYHLSTPATPLFAEVGIYFGYFWLLVSGMLLIAKKYRKTWFPIWLGIILFLPWGVLKNILMLEDWELPHRLMVLFFLALSAAFVGLLFFRPAVLQRIFPPVQRFASIMLGFAAFAGLLFVIQFPWYAWEARNLNPPSEEYSRSFSPTASAIHPRVIWILFDELSHQQVYDRRFPGLKLPAFDQLANQSVMFTHVVPAGIMTERVIPSLVSGLPDDNIRISAGGQLTSLHNPTTGVWRPFSQFQTVFQDARSEGYATGVAGWFNPYCRLLSSVLDRCFWTYGNPDLRFFEPDRTWYARITSPIRFFSYYVQVSLGLTAKQMPLEIDARIHRDDYEKIRYGGDKLLADPSINFLLLHLPVPHPVGIYRRKRATSVSTGPSYLDNLVLADHYLAHVRLLLEEQHQWDSSVVIVMGDHSWRTKLLWESAPGWTAEEQQASGGGQFDDRPGYIVKMPMQQNALQVDIPFLAVRTRALLDAIISNKVQTAAGLKAWVEQQH